MFFLTIDQSLWSVCENHRSPFEGRALVLDPDEYDLEGYFREHYEWDDDPS